MSMALPVPALLAILEFSAKPTSMNVFLTLAKMELLALIR
jgi:hypothetical protein